jgi:protein-S-isoprenylcysteine O-methyltransferase Ste14
MLKHLRDILILPFTVTVIVPYIVYDSTSDVIPDNAFIKTIGVLICLSGFALFLYTVFLFGKIGKGTLAPWSPKQKLVIVGPYRYCRNPMITGVFFILTGEALFFHSGDILLWAGVFFFINTMYFIIKEEPDLEKKFGEEYRIYKKNVPRWIPKVRPYKDVA